MVTNPSATKQRTIWINSWIKGHSLKQGNPEIQLQDFVKNQGWHTQKQTQYNIHRNYVQTYFIHIHDQEQPTEQGYNSSQENQERKCPGKAWSGPWEKSEG